MAGAKPKSSVTCYLATQADDRFDTVFDATVPLLFRYASNIWEGLVVPSRLYRAWSSIKARIDKRASWTSTRGPIATVWVSLLRVGWTMRSPTVLVSDLGKAFDLTRTCPWDLRLFLEEGIRRWQSARILQHHPNGRQESCWRRAMRNSILAIKDASRRGALRALWSAGVWTPVRLHSINLRPTPNCFVCQQCPGTEAHQWFGCDSMLNVPRDERPPDDVLEHRAAMIDQHSTVLDGMDTFYLSYGLPPLPPFPADPADHQPILGRGDWAGAWGNKVYTDGSGIAPSLPGLTRCGWSVVELDESGIILRAVYGALPGAVQTVPRS